MTDWCTDIGNKGKLMKKKGFISFEELMRECNVTDSARFRRLLKLHGFRPLSSKKRVDKKLASQIVRYFTSEKPSWYEYNLKVRDTSDEGPLERKTTDIITDRVDNWYQEITQNQQSKSPIYDHLLGVACVGGFLKGNKSSDFFIHLDSSVNIFIGDRGSGKSTILNLLGLLAGSVTEETNVLVNMLLNLFDEKPKETGDFSRRVRKLLRQYGITIYACFFFQNQTVNCYYVDCRERVFTLLELQNSSWIATNRDPVDLGDSMQILQQGEVLKISDEGNKFYLNNILDALYPDLFQRRNELAHHIKKVTAQVTHFEIEFLNGDMEHEPTSLFISERARELYGIRNDIEHGNFSAYSINTIAWYVDWYYSIQNRSFLRDKSIFELLRGGEEKLWYLYIGRISGFLSAKMKEIDLIREQPSEIRAGNNEDSSDSEEVPSAEDISAEKETLTSIEESIEDLISGNDSGTVANFNLTEDSFKNLRNEKIPADILERLKPLENKEMIGKDGFLATIKKQIGERQTFKYKMLILKHAIVPIEEALSEYEQSNVEGSPESEEEIIAAIKAEKTVKEKLLEVGREIVEFIETRLRILRTWAYLYNRRQIIAYKPPLASLISKYIELVNIQNVLIEEQEAKCQSIKNVLNRDNIEINVSTIEAQNIISDHLAEIDRLNSAYELYNQFLQATPMSKVGHLFHLANSYDNITKKFLEKIGSMGEEVTKPENRFLFNPINIELRQGRTYRKFKELSFGQKSGIILKMVLESTNKSVIVIDQPEDNLDAHSIVNMLAPTLKRLGFNRQIFVATHNSNLVMGLPTKNLVVLESLGDNGRIRIQGANYQPDIIREMMDILEGGIPTFDLKMKMYEDFITRIRGAIEDMDIMTIESSFRRRTIDGLRNFLQPIVSDKSILNFLRHELKQRDPSRIQRDIYFAKESVVAAMEKPEDNWGELLKRLENLFGHLQNHIFRMQDSIEKIRLMDTQAHPQKFNLYKTIGNIREEYLSRISKIRTIHIEIDSLIQNQSIYADEDHLKLIFGNLFSNSLRATEKRISQDWQDGNRKSLLEIIKIQLNEVSTNQISLLFSDNGCGMPQEIREKLYTERCSDQRGRDHGLGGIIIRKLLELNSGNIQVLQSNQSGKEIGTLQKITINWGDS